VIVTGGAPAIHPATKGFQTMSQQHEGISELDALVENMRHSEWTPSGLDDLPGLVERLKGCDTVLSQSACGVIGVEYGSTYGQGARALCGQYFDGPQEPGPGRRDDRTGSDEDDRQ
jgi:hypothetical protein